MEEEVIKRLPPNNVEAEKAVIGAMMLDSDAIMVCSEILTAGEFYQQQYGIIFDALVEMYRDGIGADLVTIQNKLREKEVTPELYSVEYLGELLASVPTSANVKFYAEIVHEKAVLRRLIKVTEFEPISDVVLRTLDSIEKAAKQKGNITGLETGFRDLDAKTAGLQKSDLILIAARPAMGKTAFVLNIAEYVALHSNSTIALFSLEMSKEQLVKRMLAMNSMVDSQKIRTGDLEDDDWDKLVGSVRKIGNSNLVIDDTSGITASELRSKCRKLKIEQGLDLVIIDYLQLMTGAGKRKSDSRQQEISDISRSLKVMARELDVPVIALSQLSRAVESRPDKRPMLSDLRESGAIEQDADIVMFIYRDEYYNPDSEKKGVAEVIVAKQRSGPTGPVELAWLSQYTKFGNLEYQR